MSTPKQIQTEPNPIPSKPKANPTQNKPEPKLQRPWSEVYKENVPGRSKKTIPWHVAGPQSREISYNKIYMLSNQTEALIAAMCE